MKEIQELVEFLKTSEPVFRLSPSTDGKEIEMSGPINYYDPHYDYALKDNPLWEVVAAHFSEHFDYRTGTYHLDKVSIADQTMQRIRYTIAQFIEYNHRTKNPIQTKLYKWVYNNMPDTLEFNNVIVMVYKYLITFSDRNMKSHDQQQIDNAIALLEAIMEKYGK